MNGKVVKRNSCETEYNIMGDWVYDRYGNVVYKVLGDWIYDNFGTPIYKMEGSYVYPYGEAMWKYRIIGNKIYTRTEACYVAEII